MAGIYGVLAKCHFTVSKDHYKCHHQSTQQSPEAGAEKKTEVLRLSSFPMATELEQNWLLSLYPELSLCSLSRSLELPETTATQKQRRGQYS
jgi:hypothetical protein